MGERSVVADDQRLVASAAWSVATDASRVAAVDGRVASAAQVWKESRRRVATIASAVTVAQRTQTPTLRVWQISPHVWRRDDLQRIPSGSAKHLTTVRR
jgi:hypothetical protein